MKKIIFKKLLSDCLIFFLVSLVGISSIIWVFQAVNFLDIMIEDGRNYYVYLQYTLFSFPKIISKVLPFCIFFSFSYVFIKYEMKNELMIYWNYGIEKISLINFFILISAILFLIQITLMALMVPKSEEIARSLLRTSDIDYFEGLIKPRKFNDNIKGLTIFAEDKNSKGEFINIYIKKKTSQNQFQITFAKKGIFEKKGENKILVLYEGQNLTTNNNKITNFSFSKSDFPLKNFKTNTTTYIKTQEISTINIFKCMYSLYYSKINPNKNFNTTIENCNMKNLKNIFKEIYKRIFIPLYIPILMLIPLLVTTSSKENINYSKLKFMVFLLGLFFIIFSETTIRLISKVIYTNYFIISIPIIVLFILYLSFYKKFNIKIMKD